jgi:alkylated DNA repair protein (DNA oxidative demethylase)
MEGLALSPRGRLSLGEGAVLLAEAAAPFASALLEAIGAISAAAPFRRFSTPGGRRMAVEMTNCGALGWISDAKGYRYSTHDPQSGRPWPAMPRLFAALAAAAAEAAGFPAFLPDACLINRYGAGIGLSPHQDRDEADLSAPIVSVSLGLSATFLWGGPERRAPLRRLPLAHGDIVVWGGPARLFFHGIAPLRPGQHPLTGSFRYNLTFRRAGPADPPSEAGI